MCKEAWLRLHGCSENRMYSLKRKACDDFREVERPKQKIFKWNPKYEDVKTFLDNYFAPENGRCERLPNPRYGKEEFRLPIWLSKLKVFLVYVEDSIACQSKCLLILFIVSYEYRINVFRKQFVLEP